MEFNKEEYNRHFKELQDTYNRKYFKILTDENRNKGFNPERHELIYILNIYQYFPEGDSYNNGGYFKACMDAFNDGLLFPFENKPGLMNSKTYSDQKKELIAKHYKLTKEHTDEAIEVDNGYAIQYINGGAKINYVGSTIYNRKDLIEITKEEFDETYKLVKELTEQNLNVISKLS